MAEIDDNLERQINRALDGELDADERLALGRELIRNPQAREVMERSEQIDALAGEALRSLLSDGATGDVCSSQVSHVWGRRGYHRAWWLLPGAVAAAILAMLWVYTPSSQKQLAENGTGNTAQRTEGLAVGVKPAGRWPTVRSGRLPGGLVPVYYRPTRIDRAIDRGVYGVRGTDGNIYLIDVRRTRTHEQPGSNARTWPVGGDM
ncbi:MAG: hypothetical protein KAV82_06575 [Phycisphaerae bacterium]|nr:hypothetical protein [Phycisphaerae bacterium]